MKIQYRSLLIMMTLFLSGLSCGKNFLEVISDDSLVIPSTLDEVQAVLDNEAFMNGNNSAGGPVPALTEMGTTDIYVVDSDVDQLGFFSKQVYTWQPVVFSGEERYRDWSFPYRAVFYANTALAALNKIAITPVNRDQYVNLYGAALFFRAFSFFNLAQVFAPYYNGKNGSKPGLPLRLSPDISEKSTRATLEQTYLQIEEDLKIAAQMLPALSNLQKTRPSKSAALAMLARMYLTGGIYDKAEAYADSVLQLQPQLLNYNELKATDSYPFPADNKEVIFKAILQDQPRTILYPTRCRVDSLLIKSYDNNDLRKALFFGSGGSRGGYIFKGSYGKGALLFGGLAVDEMYLIRAEARSRRNAVQEAMNDLNMLLQTRFKTDSFKALAASDQHQALAYILNERRKELLMRGLRWSDLRRLNDEGEFAVTLTRTVKGMDYHLLPGDLKYTYPIPPDVISFNPGMPQNQRQ